MDVRLFNIIDVRPLNIIDVGLLNITDMGSLNIMDVGLLNMMDVESLNTTGVHELSNSIVRFSRTKPDHTATIKRISLPHKSPDNFFVFWYIQTPYLQKYCQMRCQQ